MARAGKVAAYNGEATLAGKMAKQARWKRREATTTRN